MSVIDEIFSERPAFHIDDGRDVFSVATEGTLRLLERYLHEGMRTLETGCGASTVAFAKAATSHTVISPSLEEQRRVREYCSGHGISIRHVRFIVGVSDQVLPKLDGEFNLAFIDGAHSFPHPVIDWHYMRRLLCLDGLLFLDDVPIPAVGIVARHLASSTAWELIAIADNRATVWRKITEESAGDAWKAQDFNKDYPDYSFLPFRARLRVGLERKTGLLRGRVARVIPRSRRRSLR